MGSLMRKDKTCVNQPQKCKGSLLQMPQMLKNKTTYKHLCANKLDILDEIDKCLENTAQMENLNSQISSKEI